MHKPKLKSLNAGLALLLIVITLMAIQLVDTLRTRQQMALDLAEVKDVKYGLLNADVWVQRVTTIIEKRVDDFELTPKNRALIKPILEQGLATLITEADLYMRQQNKAGGFAGNFKQGVQDMFVDTKKVKAGIPRYADKIMDALNKPESRRQISDLLKNLLSDVKQTTFAEVDKGPLTVLRAKYECKDREACQKAITDELEANNIRGVWQALTLLALTAVLFITVRLAPGINRTRLGLLVLCSTVLMLCGVLTPMMEVEARISELRFVLLSQPVVFADQVLYFKSKSVLDVARVLMSNGKLNIKLVGVLVLTFGVIFPLLKLAASFVYLYDLKRLRQSRIVQFFAFKSGKWSMADVFVISILMAYIGFDELISNQLSRLAAKGGDSGVQIVTTNGTSLQIGFFIFLAFCFFSMITAGMIESRLRDAKLDEYSVPK